jgi:hypothetical protein
MRQSSDGEGSVPNLACMFLQLCPADAHERDCDTRCNLPLQGLDADNCHTVTAGFCDAKKLAIVVDCDENKLVCRTFCACKMPARGRICIVHSSPIL